MITIQQSIHHLTTPNGYKWYDVCLKVPILPDYLKSPAVRDDDNPFGIDMSDDELWEDDREPTRNPAVERDPLIAYYPSILCPTFNGLKRACWEDSILELFGEDGNISANDIQNLTHNDILDAINKSNFRPARRIKIV